MQPAGAGGLPEIKVSATNPVPACATPGRMMDFLKSRNPELDPRYESIATEYMRLGEELGVRWDYAFYQMIIETGSLSYRNGNRTGDVKPAQNNFAGLGATGGGEPGESFKDIATGVRGAPGAPAALCRRAGRQPGRRAHPQGAGVGRADALAGQASSGRSRSPTWPPNGRPAATPTPGCWRRSPSSFDGRFCAKPDPRPELVREARGQQPETPDVAAQSSSRPSGAELAQRAHRRQQGAGPARSALGAQTAAKPSVPFKVLKAPATAARAGEPFRSACRSSQRGHGRAAGDAKTPQVKAPTASRRRRTSEPAKSARPTRHRCAWHPPPDGRQADRRAAGRRPEVPRVDGQLRRAEGDDHPLAGRKVVNYTVLDVNEGAEKREADAYIAAYAKDGKIAGEFASQTQALDKAFELCPEG